MRARRAPGGCRKGPQQKGRGRRARRATTRGKGRAADSGASPASLAHLGQGLVKSLLLVGGQHPANVLHLVGGQPPNLLPRGGGGRTLRRPRPPLFAVVRHG